MNNISVTRVINAPIEKVFDLLADHANYKQFPGIKDSKLVKESARDKNGVGAVREIAAANAWFQEEITAYERPTRLDYLIVKSRPPIEHKGGSVKLKPHPQGCEVTWTTAVHFDIPLLGSLLDRLLLPQLERGLAGTLKHIEKKLAA